MFWYTTTQLILSPQVRSNSGDRIKDLKEMIDKGKSSNRSYPEDFNLEAILKGIKDISKDHLTEAEKNSSYRIRS